jgi:hypothetical protein
MRQFRVQGAKLGYPTLCFEQVHRLPLFSGGEAVFHHDHGVSRGIQYRSHVRESMGAICKTKVVNTIRFWGGPRGAAAQVGIPFSLSATSMLEGGTGGRGYTGAQNGGIHTPFATSGAEGKVDDGPFPNKGGHTTRLELQLWLGRAVLGAPVS